MPCLLWHYLHCLDKISFYKNGIIKCRHILQRIVEFIKNKMQSWNVVAL